MLPLLNPLLYHAYSPAEYMHRRAQPSISALDLFQNRLSHPHPDLPQPWFQQALHSFLMLPLPHPVANIHLTDLFPYSHLFTYPHKSTSSHLFTDLASMSAIWHYPTTPASAPPRIASTMVWTLLQSFLMLPLLNPLLYPHTALLDECVQERTVFGHAKCCVRKEQPKMKHTQEVVLFLLQGIVGCCRLSQAVARLCSCY